jgi:hypothetical protein
MDASTRPRRRADGTSKFGSLWVGSDFAQRVHGAAKTRSLQCELTGEVGPCASALSSFRRSDLPPDADTDEDTREKCVNAPRAHRLTPGCVVRGSSWTGPSPIDSAANTNNNAMTPRKPKAMRADALRDVRTDIAQSPSVSHAEVSFRVPNPLNSF